MLKFLDSLNRWFGRRWDDWFEPVKMTKAAWYEPPLLWYLLGALAFSVLLFVVLQKLPKKARKRLIIACTFLAGLFYLLEFAIPGKGPDSENALTDWLPRVGDAVAVMGAFTWGLGLINLTQVHGKAIARMKSGWYNSIAFFVGLFGIMIFGFWKDYAGIAESSMRLPAVGYKILFNGFFQNLGASVFSLLAFYIVSAAYRAFRIRSMEATIMMLAAFVVMLGQVPLGQWLTHGLSENTIWGNLRIESISEWLLTGINGAAQRGIAFGMSIGALAMSLCIWLSLERGSFFDQEV